MCPVGSRAERTALELDRAGRLTRRIYMAVASLFEDLLDQYKIEQHIARKRYTDLFQAYDVDDDRQVRIDTLRPEFAGESSFAGRFVNRARALAQVRHPNIAPILHIGKAAGGAPYVAQAAVDGYSLTHRLEQLDQRNSPVNPIYAHKLIRQLADALILGERLELFHYDLQPDNVLLKNVTLPTDDSVVLIDLFIPTERQMRANLPAADSNETEYLSPEQRAGREVTAASQVYSLGALLYRLLSGHMPPKPVRRQDTLLNRLFGRSTSLERERGDLTPATYSVIERSLSKDPRARYQTIEAFAAALDGALAAEESRPGMTGERAPISRRRPMAWLLPILILALLLTVGAVAMRGLANRGSVLAGSTPVLANTMISQPDAGGLPLPPATDTPEPTDAPPSPTLAASGGSSGGEGIATTTAEPSATGTAESTPTPTATAEPAATEPASATPAPPRVRVMHNLVNLRRGPGIEYALSGAVTGGEMLEILARNNDRVNPWYLIITGDQRIAWIAATVVQPESEEALASVPVAATIPPTPVPSPTSTPTPTLTAILTLTPTPNPGGLDDGGGTRPPVDPTSPPPPTVEPTRTPPSFTPSP